MLYRFFSILLILLLTTSCAAKRQLTSEEKASFWKNFKGASEERSLVIGRYNVYNNDIGNSGKNLMLCESGWLEPGIWAFGDRALAVGYNMYLGEHKDGLKLLTFSAKPGTYEVSFICGKDRVTTGYSVKIPDAGKTYYIGDFTAKSGNFLVGNKAENVAANLLAIAVSPIPTTASLYMSAETSVADKQDSALAQFKRETGISPGLLRKSVAFPTPEKSEKQN